MRTPLPAAGSGVPFLSIVVPVWQPDIAHFREALSSVFRQTDPGWELVLVADGPQSPQVMAAASHDDRRVIVVERAHNGGIVAATNDGIAAATGEFVGFLDNDDTLAPTAVQACREAAARWDDVDLIYSDEDKLSPSGRRIEPFPKPGWSPERLLSQNYVNHLTVIRRSLIDDLGGLRAEFEGSQDYDLVLRAGERSRRVVHIPEVLYHWRQAPRSVALDVSAKSWAFDAGVRAVQAALDRRAIPATAIKHQRFPGVIDLEPHAIEGPLVSIVMLTGGARRVVRGADVVLVEQAIASIVDQSTYASYEIILVVDRHTSEAVVDLATAAGPGRVRIVRDGRPFNYSAANNLGVAAASGDVLVFLNDDTEVRTPNWLERIVMFASVTGVGAVGACLEFGDGRVQHAGVSARGGGMYHPYLGVHASLPGECATLAVVRNTLAVTGACLGVRRCAFDDVGGFTTELPMNFNDVDFCLKLLRGGYRNIVDMGSRLVHHEHSSRPKRVDPWEHEWMLEQWPEWLFDDPWDNPAFIGVGAEQIPPPVYLTTTREASGIRFAPRVWPLDLGPAR